MIEQHNESQSATGTGLPRRSIVKGAAWSVPVIAAVAAMPLAAASPRIDCAVVDSFSHVGVGTREFTNDPTPVRTNSSTGDHYWFADGTIVEMRTVMSYTYTGTEPVLASSLSFHPAVDGIYPTRPNVGADFVILSATLATTSGDFVGDYNGLTETPRNTSWLFNGVVPVPTGSETDVQPGEVFTLTFVTRTTTSAPASFREDTGRSPGSWTSSVVFSCGTRITPDVPLHELDYGYQK